MTVLVRHQQYNFNFASKLKMKVNMQLQLTSVGFSQQKMCVKDCRNNIEYKQIKKIRKAQSHDEIVTRTEMFAEFTKT